MCFIVVQTDKMLVQFEAKNWPFQLLYGSNCIPTYVGITIPIRQSCASLLYPFFAILSSINVGKN